MLTTVRKVFRSSKLGDIAELLQGVPKDFECGVVMPGFDFVEGGELRS